MNKRNLLVRLDALVAPLRRTPLRVAIRPAKNVLRKVLGDTIQERVDDFSLHADIDHRGYLTRLGEGREDYLVELFRSSISAGMTVLDIGAFVGYFTLIAARAVGASGHVYAFEPDPRNFGLLERNVRANGFVERVEMVRAAVSDRPGRSSFLMDRGDSSSSSLIVTPGPANETTVEVVALDEFLAPESHVDVVKMDIQGAELRALGGMRRLLARRPPPTALFIECWPEGLAVAGTSPNELVAWLRSAGFAVEVVNEEERQLLPFGRWIAEHYFVDLYCHPAVPTT